MGGRELGTRRPLFLWDVYRLLIYVSVEKNNIKSNLRERGKNRRVLCLEAQIKTDFEKGLLQREIQ